MSSQYGELRPTSGWDWFVSLGHPADFNWFRVLAVLLYGTLAVGVSQTLRRWTEGATYIQQGGHRVEHRPTFWLLVVLYCEVEQKRDAMLRRHTMNLVNRECLMCFNRRLIWIAINFNEEETYCANCSRAVWRVSYMSVFTTPFCIHVSKYIDLCWSEI